MLVVVEHVKDRLRVLHLHLLRDVRSHQQLGPGLWHPRELPAVIVEADMDDVGELGGVGDVGLLMVVVLRLLDLVGLVLLFLLRLLGQWPHVHRQAHLGKYNVILEFETSMERRVGGRKPMFMGNSGGLMCIAAQLWEGEDVQLPAKAEPGFVCSGHNSNSNCTRSLLHTAGQAGLSTRERNPTRRSFRKIETKMPHLVVTLVRGVPERGSGRLLLVRHHAQQLLNLEAGVDTGAAVADTLRKKIYRFLPEFVFGQEAPLGLGKGGAV